MFFQWSTAVSRPLKSHSCRRCGRTGSQHYCNFVNCVQMSLEDTHTREQHQLYVNRWLAADEDDRQVIRELPVHRPPAGDSLPGAITASLEFSSEIHYVHYCGLSFTSTHGNVFSHELSPNSTWLVTSHLDITRRVEPMHFGYLELVEQHGSTRSSRRA